MPVYDLECTKCKKISEMILSIEEHEKPQYCSCGSKLKPIITAGSINCANEDAEWIRSVTEVVNKDGGPHCQRFLKNPTRANYKKWMKGEGIRHRENGEDWRPPPVNEKKLLEEVLEKDARRRAITVR